MTKAPPFQLVCPLGTSLPLHNHRLGLHHTKRLIPLSFSYLYEYLPWQTSLLP